MGLNLTVWIDRWRSDDSKEPPLLLEYRSSKWFISSICSFSVFTDMILYSLIIPVLPFALNERIGIPQHEVQRWISILLAIFGASLFVGSPFAGWWADRSKTRKVPFLAGLLCLTISTLAFCLARSLPLLLVARIFQGLSSAIVWTVAMAILTDTFGSHELGVGMAGVTIARTVGVVAGPLLGGVIYAQAGYYAVFYVAFGLLVLDIFLRLVMIEPKEAAKWAVDHVVDLELGQTNNEFSSETELTSPEFVRSDSDQGPMPGDEGVNPKKSRLPAIFSAAKSPRMLVALWGSLIEMILFGGLDATIPIFVNRTFNWDSSGAGLVFLAVVIPTSISPLIGWLSDRHGPRWYVVSGLFLLAVPLVLLQLVTQNNISHKVLLCALLALIGGFVVFFEIPLWVEVVKSVQENTGNKGARDSSGEPDHTVYAQAFALSNQTSAIGTVIGPLWGGLVYEHAGWTVMSWTFGTLFAVSAIPALIWTGGNIFKKRLDKVKKNESEVSGGG